MVEAYGNCPAWFLQTCFLFMNPVANLIEKNISFYEQMDDPRSMTNHFALESWVNDGIPVAGEVFREFVKSLYQRNLLVKGELSLGGRRVDLARITCPLLLLTAKNDHLVTPASTEGIRPHVATPDIESMEIGAGHVGLVVSSRAHKSFWPAATRWLGDRSTPLRGGARAPDNHSGASAMSIRISGIGGYVPQKTVTNHELAMRIDTSHEWIAAKTGIVERRVSDEKEAPSDMGCEAARRCLAHAGIEKSEVDLIVVACATPDQSQPAVACMVQEKLGVADRQCPAFDVNSVCAGFVFALNVAQSMMLTAPTKYRHALVIGTDAFSKIMNWHDRRTCVFFGDGAGAVLLSQSDRGDGRIRFHLGSDGRGSRHIEVPGGGTRMPISPEVLEKRLNTFVMNGPKVWDFAVDTVPRVDSFVAGRARPDALRPRPDRPAPEQPPHAGGDHALARDPDGPDGHHRRDLRQHRGGQHPADVAEGLRGREAACRGRRSCCADSAAVSPGAPRSSTGDGSEQSCTAFSSRAPAAGSAPGWPWSSPAPATTSS